MDQPKRDPAASQREAFLVIFLSLLVVGGALVFAMVLMGMFVIHALTILAVVVAFGFLHYLVWGRSMSHQVEVEREEEEGFRPVDQDESIQARKY